MSATVLALDEKEFRKINNAINQLAAGRSNAVGTVTLTANAASTVVTAQNCGAGSRISLTATTANAAAALATTYVSAVSATSAGGSFTITHANNAQTDKTFYWLALG